MPEQSAEETPNTPWLAIAVALLLLGVVVTIGLGSVEPPPPPAEPQLVRHVRADLGNWEPFVDVARTSDMGIVNPDVGEAAP